MYIPQKTIRNINADGTGEIYAILLTGYAKWLAITAHYTYIVFSAILSYLESIFETIMRNIARELDLMLYDFQNGTQLWKQYHAKLKAQELQYMKRKYDI